VPGGLLVDAAPERAEPWRRELEAAGYRIDPPEPDLIVLAIPGAAVGLTEALASGVPVLGVVAPESWEAGMRAAIEGAVRCIAEPVEPGAMVAAVAAVLGPDAPPIAEQRRRARQRALTLLARYEARGAASDDDDQPRSVHLTRLEHAPGPGRAPEPESLSEARRRLPTLTTKQRGLLQVLAGEDGVSAAATRLGTSRGNVYAGLRRIVHRLGVRDTAELLRLVGDGRLLDADRSS
jgi:DNA-binding NarL/FixJ family response regulator